MIEVDTIIHKAVLHLLDRTAQSGKHLVIGGESQLGLSYSVASWAASRHGRYVSIVPGERDRTQDLLWRVAQALEPVGDLFSSPSEPPVRIGRGGTERLLRVVQRLVPSAGEYRSPAVIVVDPISQVRSKAAVREFCDELARLLAPVPHHIVLVARSSFPLPRQGQVAGKHVWLSREFIRRSRLFAFSEDMLNENDVVMMARSQGADETGARHLATVWRDQALPVSFDMIERYVAAIARSGAATLAGVPHAVTMVRHQ